MTVLKAELQVWSFITLSGKHTTRVCFYSELVAFDQIRRQIDYIWPLMNGKNTIDTSSWKHTVRYQWQFFKNILMTEIISVTTHSH